MEPLKFEVLVVWKQFLGVHNGTIEGVPKLLNLSKTEMAFNTTFLTGGCSLAIVPQNLSKRCGRQRFEESIGSVHLQNLREKSSSDFNSIQVAALSQNS